MTERARDHQPRFAPADGRYDRFAWMGDHIAEYTLDRDSQPEYFAVEVLRWAGAADDDITRARELCDDVEYDEYGDVPTDEFGQLIRHPGNERLFDELTALVRPHIDVHCLTVDRNHRFRPDLQVLETLHRDPDAAHGNTIEVNDHGNVSCSFEGHEIWSCV